MSTSIEKASQALGELTRMSDRLGRTPWTSLSATDMGLTAMLSDFVGTKEANLLKEYLAGAQQAKLRTNEEPKAVSTDEPVQRANDAYNILQNIAGELGRKPRLARTPAEDSLYLEIWALFDWLRWRRQQQDEKPHYTADEIRQRKAEARDLLDKLHGRGKHNVPSNFCRDDGIFANSIMTRFGVDDLKKLDRWAKSGQARRK